MVRMQFKRPSIGMSKSRSWDEGWADSGAWTRGEHSTWFVCGAEIVYSHWRSGWLAASWSGGEHTTYVRRTR